MDLDASQMDASQLDAAISQAQDEAEAEALALNNKVTDMYARMTLAQRETAKKKAERTLHRAQQSLLKIQSYLTSPPQQDEHPTLPSSSLLDHMDATELTTNATDLMAAYHIEDEIQDDDGENSMDAKHITRWWRRCLELIETLIQDGCGLVFDNVRQFLLQFNQQQAMLQASVENLRQQELLPEILEKCEKRLARLQVVMERKSKKLAPKAKENLEEEMAALHDFQQNPKVKEFLGRVSDTFILYYTQFQADVQNEDQKRAQRIEKIIQMKKSAEQDTRNLNRKLDLYLKKAQQETDVLVAQLKQQQQH